MCTLSSATQSSDIYCQSMSISGDVHTLKVWVAPAVTFNQTTFEDSFCLHHNGTEYSKSDGNLTSSSLASSPDSSSLPCPSKPADAVYLEIETTLVTSGGGGPGGMSRTSGPTFSELSYSLGHPPSLFHGRLLVNIPIPT